MILWIPVKRGWGGNKGREERGGEGKGGVAMNQTKFGRKLTPCDIDKLELC